MPSRDYHEGLWEVLPEGLEPSDFELRKRFLLAGVPRGARVLDVGCGEGVFTAELSGAGAEVVGIDVAEEPLRRARARHPELDLRLVDGEAAWSLPDAEFDVVWAGEVIEHVADTARWLSEVRRVLRPHGTLLLTTPAHDRLGMLRLALSRRELEEQLDPRGEHLRFYTKRTLEALLDDFGFEQIDAHLSGRPASRHRVLLARARRSRY
jgi:2-polyprenyl-3-methyl-5-hydroxy-6-metoxy-1,4-benzoquinol methylase